MGSNTGVTRLVESLLIPMNNLCHKFKIKGRELELVDVHSKLGHTNSNFASNLMSIHFLESRIIHFISITYRFQDIHFTLEKVQDRAIRDLYRP